MFCLRKYSLLCFSPIQIKKYLLTLLDYFITSNGITDKTTFAYLADVFILEEYRKKGLSKWLIETIQAYPDLQGLRRWMPGTRDAHGLYEKFGWTVLDEDTRKRFMQRQN